MNLVVLRQLRLYVRVAEAVHVAKAELIDKGLEDQSRFVGLPERHGLQPTERLGRLIQEQRLASVLNLRGGSMAEPFYANEVAVTSTLGVVTLCR